MDGHDAPILGKVDVDLDRVSVEFPGQFHRGQGIFGREMGGPAMTHDFHGFTRSSEEKCKREQPGLEFPHRRPW